MLVTLVFHYKLECMNSEKVFVVVPNWNGEDWVAECIDSLLKQTYACNIVVIENGSVDNSIAILKKYGKKITILEQPKNLGFAGGVNVGIRYALAHDATYIALFNNDAVADKDWAKQLVQTIHAKKTIGMVAAKILHTDQATLDSTGDFYTIFGLPFPRGRGAKDVGQFDSQLELFGVSGGASLYRSDMLREVGLFDEDFFAYFEDVDVSFRAQLAGWEARFAPKARVYHRISATSSRLSGFGSYQTAKNIPLLYLKNMPGYLFWKYLPLAAYWYARMAAARVVKGGFLPFIKGWFRALLLTPKKLRERRYIQAKRKITTQAIDDMIYHAKPPKIQS